MPFIVIYTILQKQTPWGLVTLYTLYILQKQTPWGLVTVALDSGTYFGPTRTNTRRNLMNGRTTAESMKKVKWQQGDEMIKANPLPLRGCP